MSTTPAALAAPMTSAVPATQASSAATPESTQEDKVRAAAALGILAGDDLLVLNDQDFVIALWRRATGTEVRASAELAFAGSRAECTQWIKTGIHEAKRRDDLNEVRDAEIARQARELKQRAAATIGIAAEPELLIASYRDFVYELYRRATGPKVKAAALDAFGGDEAAQQDFLETGIVAAHRADQQDAIDADHEASEAEKARMAARDAKANAAAVLGIVATESILTLSDENFVREIWNRATPGTEVAVAAEKALRSSDPAAWTAFIGTGIFEANKRDIAIALQKKADADRKRVQEIKARADSGHLQPTLSQTADNVLARNDIEFTDQFLRIGQYETGVLSQSLQADTEGARGAFVRGTAGEQAIADLGELLPRDGANPDAVWKIVPGLADLECYSLESVSNPNSYLRQQDLRVTIAPSDGTDRFRADATWCARASIDDRSTRLESKSAPGRYLRHYYGKLYAANSSGANPFDTKNKFDEDTVWRANVANFVVTGVERRWLNDAAIRDRIGNPVAAETEVDGIRYRDYERGRLTWTEATGAKQMEGRILQLYIERDLIHSNVFGAPTTDESGTPDGKGRYNHFADGGSIYFTASTGAHPIHGAIKERWRAMGWEKSYLGYPTTDEFDVPTGRCNNFQHGSITYNSSTQIAKDSRTQCVS